MSFPQKPARRYTNPRMGARAVQEHPKDCEACAHGQCDGGQERLEEEVAAPEGTATLPATGASDTHFANFESTASFPTEGQIHNVAYRCHDAFYTEDSVGLGKWNAVARAALLAVAPLVNGIADQRDAARAEAVAKVNEFAEENADLRSANQDFAEFTSDLIGKLDAAHAERDRARALLRGMARRASELRREKHRWGVESDRLLDELDDYRTRLRAGNEAYVVSTRKLDADLSAVRAELEAAREKLEREQGLAAVLRRERDSSREVNRRMVSKLAAAQRDRDAALADAGKLSGTIREQAAELASLREELAEAHRVLRDQGREIGCECFELGDGKYRPEECPIHGPFIDETRPPIKRAGSLPDNALDSVLRVVTDVVDLTDGQRLVLAMNLEPLLSPVVPAAAAKTCNEIVWPEGEDENGEPCIRDRGHGGVHQTEHYYYDAGQSAWLRMVVPVPVEQWVADDPEHRRAYQADDGSQVFEVGYRPVPVEPPAAEEDEGTCGCGHDGGFHERLGCTGLRSDGTGCGCITPKFGAAAVPVEPPAHMLRILPSHLREIAGDVTTHPEETRDALLHWADEIESWPAPAAPGVAPTVGEPLCEVCEDVPASPLGRFCDGCCEKLNRVYKAAVSSAPAPPVVGEGATSSAGFTDRDPCPAWWGSGKHCRLGYGHDGEHVWEDQ